VTRPIVYDQFRPDAQKYCHTLQRMTGTDSVEKLWATCVTQLK
jgi:hypothetical protein